LRTVIIQLYETPKLIFADIRAVWLREAAAPNVADYQAAYALHDAGNPQANVVFQSLAEKYPDAPPPDRLPRQSAGARRIGKPGGGEKQVSLLQGGVI